MESIHPRLSVNALSSWSWSFEQDLALWRTIDGIHHVGLLAPKLDAFGHDRAIDALREVAIAASCIVAGTFDLRDRSSWDATRKDLARCIDTACALEAQCIYITTGRTTHEPWRDVLETFAEAVAPTVAYGAERGMQVALEPSRRVEVSFAHTLRDGAIVGERAGIGVVVDIGNCWMEREVEAAIAECAPRIALVQIADVQVGTMASPGLDGKGVPGDGDLPMERWLAAVLATGYAGQIELEMVGSMVETIGYRAAIERAVITGSELLDRLIPVGDTTHTES
jgi:sugar phosphate isomerase/epimerase